MHDVALRLMMSRLFQLARQQRDPDTIVQPEVSKEAFDELPSVQRSCVTFDTADNRKVVDDRRRTSKKAAQNHFRFEWLAITSGMLKLLSVGRGASIQKTFSEIARICDLNETYVIKKLILPWPHFSRQMCTKNTRRSEPWEFSK